MEGLYVLLGLAFLAGVRLLANRTDTLVGRICRAWWNISFSIAAIIPFCGWMTRFVIADPETKEYLVNMGDANDEYFFGKVADSAQAELARQKRDAEIRSRLDSKGLTDVYINEDGTHATAKDKYGNPCEVRIEYE